MNIPAAWPQVLDFFGTPLVIEPSPGQLTSDAGLLPLRPFDDMYERCEGLRVSYTFGLSANTVLQRETEGLLAEAAAGYERERQAARQQDPPRPPAPSRLFTGFAYQAGTWPQPRWVVAKAEAVGQDCSPATSRDRQGAAGVPTGPLQSRLVLSASS